MARHGAQQEVTNTPADTGPTASFTAKPLNPLNPSNPLPRFGIASAIIAAAAVIFAVIPPTAALGASLALIDFLLAAILLVTAIVTKKSKALAILLLGISFIAVIIGGMNTSTHHDSPLAQSATSPSTSSQSSSADSAANASTSDAADGTALKALEALSVKGRAPKTGYTREQFGPAWSDVDHNGCDTRNDVLKRDLTDETFKAGTHDCIVLTGKLKDPYTATLIHFVRGEKTSTKVQIDHVVALSDAWQTGAQKISAEQRKQLANDPYNLLAVDGPANEQKSDGDAATWLPANTAFRCAYIARQIGVKQKYSLWVTPSEKTAMKSVLDTCPTQTVPQTDGAGEVTVTSSDGLDSDADSHAAAKSTKSPSQKKSSASGSSVAAGAAAGAATSHSKKAATPKKTVPKKTVAPRKSVTPRKATPRKSTSAPKRTTAAPKKTAPRKAAPRRTAPRRTAPRRTTPRKTVPKRSTSSGSSYYKNCKAVWNALGHGIYRGDPGYSGHLDRDGDGRACETRPNY
jgi:hypothetical protein